MSTTIKVGDVGTCQARRGKKRDLAYSVIKTARGMVRVIVEDEAGVQIDTLDIAAFEAKYKPGLTLDALLEIVRALPPPTPEERRQQAISFAYGNTKLSNPHVTREMVEAAFDRLHPNGYPAAPVAPAVPPPAPVPAAVPLLGTPPAPPAPTHSYVRDEHGRAIAVPPETTAPAPPQVDAAPDREGKVTERPGMANIGALVDRSKKHSGNA